MIGDLRSRRRRRPARSRASTGSSTSAGSSATASRWSTSARRSTRNPGGTATLLEARDRPPRPDPPGRRRLLDGRLRRGLLPLPRARHRRARAAARVASCASAAGSRLCPRRVRARARAGAGDRGPAAAAGQRLRDQQARHRGAGARPRRGLRLRGVRAALPERLRAAAGARQPLHGRRRDLLRPPARRAGRRGCSRTAGRSATSSTSPTSSPRRWRRWTRPGAPGRAFNVCTGRRITDRRAGRASSASCWRPSSSPRSPASSAPATSATASPTRRSPASCSASRPQVRIEDGLPELVEWVAAQTDVDRARRRGAGGPAGEPAWSAELGARSRSARRRGRGPWRPRPRGPSAARSVTSPSSSRRVTSAISSTARSKTSWLACDGLVEPEILRTYWSDEAWISSSVAGGSKLWSVLMLRHMAAGVMRRRGRGRLGEALAGFARRA